MTESKAETASKPAKELLALNPKQESEFKKKVQEVKKNKSSKVGRDESVALRETRRCRDSRGPLRRLCYNSSLLPTVLHFIRKPVGFCDLIRN